jgi:hypothetical protein
MRSGRPAGAHAGGCAATNSVLQPWLCELEMLHIRACSRAPLDSGSPKGLLYGSHIQGRFTYARKLGCLTPNMRNITGRQLWGTMFTC